MKNETENNDVWAAVAIGAVVGIGAALLFRGQQDDDTGEIMRRLRPVKKRAGKAVRAAGSEIRSRTRDASRAGGDLMSAGEDILDEIRSGARDIVQNTREELREAVRESMVEARRAAKRARKSFG